MLNVRPILPLILFLAFGSRLHAQNPVVTEIYQDSIFTLYFTAPDRDEAQRLLPLLRRGVREVETFFGSPFPHRFDVRIFSDRADLDRQWQTAWADTSFHSACWMVASGVGDRLDVLTPRRWADQACEHRADDATALARLLTHELVHVYHGQHNARPDFMGMDELGWWIEGIATYASGQLDPNRMAALRTAIEQDKSPKALEAFWSGKNRYGQAGSLAACIDERLGRAALLELLRAASTAEALQRIGLSEAELIEAWKKYCR
jgi:hypothetical protein